MKLIKKKKPQQSLSTKKLRKSVRHVRGFLYLGCVHPDFWIRDLEMTLLRTGMGRALKIPSWQQFFARHFINLFINFS